MFSTTPHVSAYYVLVVLKKKKKKKKTKQNRKPEVQLLITASSVLQIQQ